MLCSDARLLDSVLRSSKRSDPQQFRIIVHPMSDQLEARSDILFCGKTNCSSLVFSSSMLAQAISLQAAARRNNCSSFQCNSEFRIFIGNL